MVRRVSTVGQAADGYGLDAQDADCRRWNRDPSAGHRLVHSIVDGDKVSTSGKSTLDERDGLMDAVQWIADGRADGILAPNLDRLARELTVQEAVLAYVWALGGRVFTADHGEHLEDDETDPMRTAMRQMRGVFHQLDRGLIRKRLREGREAKGKQGGYAFGAPPFGKQVVDGDLVDLPQEKDVEDLPPVARRGAAWPPGDLPPPQRGRPPVEARRPVAPDHRGPHPQPRGPGRRERAVGSRPGPPQG